MFVVDRAGEMHVLLLAELSAKPFEPGAVRPISEDDEFRIGPRSPHPRKTVQEQVHPVLGPKT